jgi:hypothetical protein
VILARQLFSKTHTLPDILDRAVNTTDRFRPHRTSADDLTGDGVIDVSDVLEMLTAFGMTCPGGTELPPGIAIGRPC